jgi:hypothetical protein
VWRLRIRHKSGLGGKLGNDGINELRAGVVRGGEPRFQRVY